MNIDKLITKNYPCVSYLSGVRAIEERLLASNYLIVLDEDNNYKGLLIPRDIALRPHKIVADCLTPKDTLTTDDTLISTITVFEKNSTPALPVFNNNTFEGVLEKRSVIEELHKEYRVLYNKELTSERVKNNFIANLAHEIRTPLNGIIGCIELLEENSDQMEMVDNESARNIIKECTNRFLLTMQNLTDLTLVQSEVKNHVRMEEVYLSTVIDTTQSHFRALNEKSGDDTEIVFSPKEYDPCLYTDKEILTEIINHLIRCTIAVFNCNKIYTGFRISENKNYLVLYISDSCILVNENFTKLLPEEDKTEINKNSLPDGLSISLTLVKEYCSLINVDVILDNRQNVNTFYCAIPLIKEKFPVTPKTE